MEFVYVVSRGELFPDAYPYGFQALGAGDSGVDSHDLEQKVRKGFFVEREYAERSPMWKQVIPYCVVVREGKILLLRRLSAGGEARLHDKLSIGVGGHINPIDAEGDSKNPVPRALERELSEELEISGSVTTRSAGIINDDSNAVGAVHVGFVYIVEVDGDVQIREKDVLEGEFVSPARLSELRREGANFETWSALLVDTLDQWLAQVGAPHSEDTPVTSRSH